MAIWIGVDVGGTFTDLVGWDDVAGRVRIHKTPSTPANPAEAILHGITELLAKLDAGQRAVRDVAHGTTVGTNALIQRKGGRIALITTDGFRDLLEIGYQNRPYVYDLHRDIPPPLVPRTRRFEVDERVTAGGNVIVPLADQEVARIVDAVATTDPEAFAVCLLFSYLRPEHERRLGAALKDRFPDKAISLSSEVQPEFREYARFSTTVLNAFLQPVMSRYIESLAGGIGAAFGGARLTISHSDGGLMSGALAHRFPVRTALSGPAAGVTGAFEIARRVQRPNAITFDMGGTSTDVALIKDSVVAHSYGSVIGGFPVRLPMVDVVTVGAGGGSIAWFDRDDLMKVGPLSAAADPGPACYGRGGSQATVTDANLVLQRLSPRGLLGGRMQLDNEAARHAVDLVAMRLSLGTEHTALGIIEIVVANMVRAIRSISIERGHDPRDFVLLAFGGGGPLHARQVATELGIREILVPPYPGILCAEGLMASGLTESFVQTIHEPLCRHGIATVMACVAELRATARRWFEAEAIAAAQQRCRVSLDLAYERQSFELSIALTGEVELERIEIPADTEVHRRFLAAHERAYGYSSAEDPVLIVNCRLKAIGLRPRPPVHENRSQGKGGARPTGRREVWFDRAAPQPTPIYLRDDLPLGARLAGPAVVEQFDSTVLVFPGDEAMVDHGGNLTIAIHR